ncbi:hypothetical protein D3C71_1185350 [compost metagenome]
MLRGQVGRFGAVLVDVVQLPLVLVEVSLAGQWRVQGGGLPAVLPDAARAEHGVVLALLLGGGVRRGLEGVLHRYAGQRVLLHATIDLGHLYPAGVQDGRYDVHAVVILVTHLALGLESLGPVNHHRATGAAGIFGVAFEHLVGRGERHGPAGGVVVIGFRSAKDIQVLEILRQFVGVAVEELVLVDRAAGAAFA